LLAGPARGRCSTPAAAPSPEHGMLRPDLAPSVIALISLSQLPLAQFSPSFSRRRAAIYKSVRPKPEGRSLLLRKQQSASQLLPVGRNKSGPRRRAGRALAARRLRPSGGERRRPGRPELFVGRSQASGVLCEPLVCSMKCSQRTSRRRERTSEQQSQMTAGNRSRRTPNW
jgi:hypothetical protein